MPTQNDLIVEKKLYMKYDYAKTCNLKKTFAVMKTTCFTLF